ncbi:MAG: filamentous hemagglutinin family protein [Akkermansiaceae bacterium]|nr:filamentous hemagglutinin family protein [Akkermansiaceae bacterium]
MKPKRHFYRFPFLSGTIRYGVPVVAGFAIFISGAGIADAAIFGGAPGAAGSTPSNPQPTAPAGGATPTASDAARDSALQALSRTREAVGAAKALQDAARAAAAAGNNAGPNPANPSQTLPDVPNGLTPGGLQPITGATPGATTWQGAELPTQAIENGLSTVTVRQTAQQALLTWQTFNVGKDTTLSFDQSAGGSAASQWIAFNKINDPSANPTQILGQIKAEGQVYIINPNGIIFGGSSQINVNNLTASSLPINDNLVARGLLNNPSQEFLFNGLGYSGKLGDVTVQAGARISTPVSADGNGGRIALVGANVTNNGTLTSPNGQVILAAGLQVGVAAHASTDPSLRGLDVYVGAVTDPASALSPYAGSATNNGLIEIARASTIITGKSVVQNGIIDSSTSVSLNGRIDLLANYNAASNPAYDASSPTPGSPFLFRAAGSVTLGENSVTRILPETDKEETVIGTELALRSQINLQGKTVHLGKDATILAPNAIANVLAGEWNYIPSGTQPSSSFVTTNGQVYLDEGSLINLAGTVDATASVTQNLITLELRGSELAVAPLQRDGELRGQTITVDLGRSGEYEGRFWVGTPLADLTGYVGLVQRNVGQLTTAGGTLNLSAGSSVVIQDGSAIDVSGGWTNFAGGYVETTQLISGNRLVDIADALPGEVYTGIFGSRVTVTHKAWGVTESFGTGVIPGTSRYQQSYTQGSAGGKLTITAPSMAIDGALIGRTIAGETQINNSPVSSNLPPAASLSLLFQGQTLVNNAPFVHYPTPPSIIFGEETDQTPVPAFSTDSSGNPEALPGERSSTVHLSQKFISESGFGSFNISNPEGDILVAAGTHLNLGPRGSLTLTSSNIDVQGGITAAGGSLSFNVHNISPYRSSLITDGTLLPVNPGLGTFTLGSDAFLSTAGLISDARISPSVPALPNGGSISIRAYSADLAGGSVIDVSGGYAMGSGGTGKFGNAGQITIRTGQDISDNQRGVLGGTLNLGASLRGYSGAKAGSLTIQGQAVQIGGTSTTPETLLLQPEFFNEGGFGTFTVTGIAGTGSNPALLVAADTVVAPIVKSLSLVKGPPGDLSFSLEVFENLPGVRPAATINLTAPGVGANTGDVVVSENSVIRTEAGGAISVTGNTVAILGSLIAPGGNINIAGNANTAAALGDPSQPLITTYIGSKAIISAAGATVLLPDPLDRRTGRVLDGGNITVGGNIAAAEGAVLDVSGTSDSLDLETLYDLSPSISLGWSQSGYAQLPSNPVVIDSNGGHITLRGGQLLASDATLLAHAGGSTALGGTLTVSSDVFTTPGGEIPPTTVRLTVTQSGSLISPSLPDSTGAIGTNIGSGGRFTADTFHNGGFDSLQLGGVTSFSGPVDINARGSIRLGGDGFIHSNAQVNLSASHIIIGRDFTPPTLPAEVTSPYATPFAPTYGSGDLRIQAKLIDIGSLSLQNTGHLLLAADGGDIRGNGTVHVTGNIDLRAGQVYPVSATSLSFIAYDSPAGQGTINIQASGNRPLPYSAGGTLGIYASVINQSGTLRAPFGSIHLGWDGTGTAPVDLIAGNLKAFPVTTSLTLGSGSVTSVSAVDPTTGKALLLPYGITTDGENWIDPRGIDITASGPPEKSISLSARNIITAEGSTIDLTGGGDLYADRFIAGLGGITDILASSGAFAVIRDYQFDYAPVLDYNPSASDQNLIEGPGYNNSALKAGDRIYLSASSSLPAGYYTLLPARYALIPGAVLVTPSSARGLNTIELPDRSSIVSGYRYSSLNTEREIPTLPSRLEIASQEVIRARALYQLHSANTFFPQRAAELNIPSPYLPKDAGYLLFQASQSLDLKGSVVSLSADGRGAAIDISTVLDTHIGSGTGTVPGTITLDSDALAAFGAESLLIGGLRTRTTTGTTVTVTSGNITVDNAGSTLTAGDIILVANNGITLADGSAIASTGDVTTPETLLLSGNGTLVRAASGKAGTIRTGVTTTTSPLLTVGDNVSIRAGSITLDSSSGLSLSQSAVLTASDYSFASQRISLLLDNPGTLSGTPGLVLDDNALLAFQNAKSLSLVSYSSIDLYGTGSIGGTALENLTLSAGEIRGINHGEGSARLVARNLSLSNLSNASAGPVSTASGSLILEAQTITLGSGESAINRYADVTLQASRGITGTGTGGLKSQGDLNLLTPRLTGGAGANRTITSGGVLSLASTGGSADLLAAGLGSSLTLSGTTVTADSSIFLPSGSLAIRALTGDVTVSGDLNVSGTSVAFGNKTKYTDAGKITLSSATGDVIVTETGRLDLSAPTGGGDAGTLSISNPTGSFISGGAIRARGGNGGNHGSFQLDTSSLASLSGLADLLTAADLVQGQTIRIRNGDVTIDGNVLARDFRLSADQGSITVTGTIDASGTTGGNIHLSAHRDLLLDNGSKITVAGQTFSSAGKGGQVTLEAGSQANGVAGDGTLRLVTGATIDLSVASKVEGNATTIGTSAYNGKFSGKLHLRAPQTSGFNDLRIDPINSSIIGASSIVAEGYRIYDLTSSGGLITTGTQNDIKAHGISFLGAAGTTSANYSAMMSRLLAGNPDLASVFVLTPGAEIINRTGDLTLGSTSTTTTSDWDLSTFRFGAKGAAGILTLRAAGNIVLHNSISDGFTPFAAAPSGQPLWEARLTTASGLLPVNNQSWSYRFSAGSDLSASDYRETLALSSLGADAGSLILGKTGTNTATGSSDIRTQSIIPTHYQVVRTGSGDIDINAGRDIRLMNQLAAIYSAGTRVTNATLDGTFDLPNISASNQSVGLSSLLGAVQQAYPALFSMAGGHVRLEAGGNIERLTRNTQGQLVADSQFQLPVNWLYRKGFVNPVTGQFGVGSRHVPTENISTGWWVDFSNFFQGVGTLGGGDVTLVAGNNVSNVDAVAATNGRMPKGIPDASKLVELGGGDVTVTAGNNIDGGIYYVERGKGSLSAGNQILTNATRSVLTQNSITAGLSSSYTQLPTTLFLGKGSFDVSANGDLLIGPVANVFHLPQGFGNSIWYKTYFSTYDVANSVDITSYGGDVTIRTAATQSGSGGAGPLLQSWLENKLSLTNSGSAAGSKPWLRLAETNVTPFSIFTGIFPASLYANALSGDVNIVGNITLAPSPTGTLEILADGSINALQPNGVTVTGSLRETTWGSSVINVSDADPAAIPGITTPFAYQTLVGTTNAASTTSTATPSFLEFVNRLFRESGATLGQVLETKQTLHAAGILHRNDPEPVRLYANKGDISGLTLYSPKAAVVHAGLDLQDLSLYLQNVRPGDTSIVSAGRDILPNKANSLLRVEATRTGNLLNNTSVPAAGDIQISGPGSLQVIAGRNIDLGTGGNNADGTGAGITSIGNVRNPYLSAQGADLLVAAGITTPSSLSTSSLALGRFIDRFVSTPEGAEYLKEIDPDLDFSALSPEQQAVKAIEVFSLILRDAGRNYAETGNYDTAYAAIDTLFGDLAEDETRAPGDILTRARDIRTASGGNINILSPGGGLTMANSTLGNTLSPPGIITASGGNISIFAQDDISIGIGRIFTLRGGNEIIWSSDGNIAAGSSSKTVLSAPPTRVIIDPQSAAVQTDLAGLATGGGIGVLATVAGVEPGNVDLIAPNGFVDAGDAGIRSAGNLNISASQVLNAGNISTGGTSTGTPAVVSVSTSMGGLTTATTPPAPPAATDSQLPQETIPEPISTEEIGTDISVEIIGYGGNYDDEDDEDEKRRKREAEEANEAGDQPAGEKDTSQ